ncbi:hypothetical protein LCGC14_0142620 [marine sediment metagenome]|uniref:Uncharacterized protein n=1 Tax=marine sediment metagenome TaxID=412755 RepID=A0A0F9VGP9_9ZZZZ
MVKSNIQVATSLFQEFQRIWDHGWIRTSEGVNTPDAIAIHDLLTSINEFMAGRCECPECSQDDQCKADADEVYRGTCVDCNGSLADGNKKLCEECIADDTCDKCHQRFIDCSGHNSDHDCDCLCDEDNDCCIECSDSVSDCCEGRGCSVCSIARKTTDGRFICKSCLDDFLDCDCGFVDDVHCQCLCGLDKDNAGCNLCGIMDREKGEVWCTDCLDDSDENDPWCDVCLEDVCICDELCEDCHGFDCVCPDDPKVVSPRRCRCGDVLQNDSTVCKWYPRAGIKKWNDNDDDEWCGDCDFYPCRCDDSFCSDCGELQNNCECNGVVIPPLNAFARARYLKNQGE